MFMPALEKYLSFPSRIACPQSMMAFTLVCILAVVVSAIAIPQAPPSTSAFACPGAPQPSFPVVAAPGYRATTLLGGLTMPRGIVIDSRGHMLVVQRGVGISGYVLGPNGCVVLSKTIVSDSSLNHGIDVTGDTLYASSQDTVYSWSYNSLTLNASNKKTLITGIYNSGNDTHTLWASRKTPGYLVVSAGSNLDILDMEAYSPNADHAVVKVFNVAAITASGSTFSTGQNLGYGLRNDVGITEDRSGAIFTVENSIHGASYTVNDQTTSVQQDNPAELLWKLGDPASPLDAFHGYPYCYKVWDPSSFPNSSFQVGDWFVQEVNSTMSTAWCDASTSQNPLTLLGPHTAPLDIKFGIGSNTAAFVSLHGSIGRTPPIGYGVVSIAGRYSQQGSWSPTTPLSSQNAYVDVIKNVDVNNCPGACYRPVGLAWSSNGQNLYVSSDITGEIFLVKPT